VIYIRATLPDPQCTPHHEFLTLLYAIQLSRELLFMVGYERPVF